MNKMLKRTLALCMVVLMTATSIIPQNVSASEIVQVVEHLSDQDTADENKNSSEASSEAATTEAAIKVTEEATTEGTTAAVEETTTAAESQKDGDKKEEATTEETTEESASKTEATTTESAVAAETTTAAEAMTEEEKTTEEATTEEPKKEKKATRDIVTDVVALEPGVTVTGSAYDDCEYVFQPKESGMYIIKLEPKQHATLYCDTYYYTESKEQNIQKDQWMGSFTAEDTQKVFFLNKEESYHFKVNTSEEFTLCVSNRVKLSNIELSKNPTNDVYKYIDFEGIELKFNYIEAEDEAKTHIVLGKMNASTNSTSDGIEGYAYCNQLVNWSSAAYDFQNWSHNSYIYESDIVAVDDDANVTTIKELEPGTHSVKIKMTMCENGEYIDYEFTFHINKIDNSNIKKIEVINPDEVIYTQTNGLVSKNIRVTYKDGKTEVKFSDEVEYYFVTEDGTRYQQYNLTGYLKALGVTNDENLDVTGTYVVIYNDVEQKENIKIQYSPYKAISVVPTRTLYYSNGQITSDDFKQIVVTNKDGTTRTYESFNYLGTGSLMIELEKEDGSYYSAYGSFNGLNIADYIEKGGKLGTVKMRVRYAGVCSEHHNITIEEPISYDHISVYTSPTTTRYLNGTYTSLDFSGMVIRAYKNEVGITYDDYSYDEWMKYKAGELAGQEEKYAYFTDNFSYKIGGSESLATLARGTHDITVNLGGKTTTFQIEIVNSIVDNLSVEFDLENYDFLLSDNTSGKIESELYFSIGNITIDGKTFHKWSQEYQDYCVKYGNNLDVKVPAIKEEGEYEVTITWLGAKTTVTVHVYESLYKEFKIINNPEKTEFYAGFDTEKSLDLEGVELVLTDQHDVTKCYKYGYYDTPGYESWGDIWNLLEWDASDVNWESPGNYTVYLTCGGVKSSIDINVVECPYKSMSFELRRKIYFEGIGDALSYFDIKNIKLYDKNGEVLKKYRDLDSISEERNCSYGFVGQTDNAWGEDDSYDLYIDKYISSCGGSIGAQKVFLKCENLEATVDITIKEGNPYKVEILKNPNNLKVLQGTNSYRLNLDGLVFRVYFDEDEYYDFDYEIYNNMNSYNVSEEESSYYYYFRHSFEKFFDNHQNMNELPLGIYNLHIKVGETEAETTIPIEVVTSVIDKFKVSLDNDGQKYLTTSDMYDVQNDLEFSFEYGTKKYEKIQKDYNSDSDYNKFVNMYGNPQYVLKDKNGNQMEDFQWYENLTLGNYTLEVTWMGATAEIDFSVVETLISNLKISFKEDNDDILLSCKNEWGYLEEHLQISFTYEGVAYKDIDVSVWDSERTAAINIDMYEMLAKKFRNELTYDISDITTPGEHEVEFTWLGSKTTAKLRFTDKLISKLEIIRMPKETIMYADRSWDIDTRGIVYGITDLKGNYKEIEAYTDEWNEEMCHDASYMEDTREVDWETVGTYNAYIHYKGLTVAIPITLIEWKEEKEEDIVESVSIVKMPTVTNYYGKIILDDDVLCDLRGMEFVVHYKDGTSYKGVFDRSEKTTVKYHDKDYYMYAYDWKNIIPGDPYSDDDEGMEDSVAYGENAVLCQLLNYNFEIPVTVYSQSPLVSIQCDKKPIKTDYFKGDWEVDLYGAQFTLLFNDDTTKTITFTEHTDGSTYVSHGAVFSIYASKDWKENKIYVRSEDCRVEIPITTYYYKKDKAVEVKENTVFAVKPVAPGEDSYRAFAFTPSKTGEYKFSADSDWYREIYLCDAKGNLLKEQYDEKATITYELEAGQTYYYVAEAGSYSTYQCILEGEEGFFSEENITSFKITEHPFQWYSFEKPDTYTYVGGLKYEISFKNGYTYKGEIYDSNDEDAYITIKPNARYNYVNVLGIPMTFQWKEYTKKGTNYYPAKTNTNRMEVSYAGYSQSLVPDFEQKTPVASVEILSHPWEDVILDEDALYYDVRDALFESIDQLKIKINYNDGKESEVYTCSSSNDELHNYKLNVKFEQEEKRIKVTYMDVSGYINLVGENNRILGITLKKAPEKKKYTDIHIGKLNVTDEIDLYGAEFTVTYTDGTKKAVKVTEHTASYMIEEGYNVTAVLKDSSLNINCKNLTFNVEIEKTGIKELAGTNQFAFAEGNSKVQDAVSFNKDMTYKIWAFTPSSEEEMTEYTFESKDTYSYLISANGTLLETADETGKITRKLYNGVTYYYAVVKNEADAADVTVTKYETQKVTELSIVVPKPVVGESLATLEGISTTTDGVKMKSIQWSRKNSEKDTVAESAAVYTATIVAETEEGYEFTGNSVYKVNGNTVYVKSLDTKGVLTVKYTFDRTDCLVTIPKLEGFTTSVDGKALSSNTAEDSWKTVVPYKNSTPVSLKYVKEQQDDNTITTLKVKANGKVLSQDETVTDAFVYELSNVTGAVNITVQTTFAPKPEEVTLTLMDGDKEYDKIAVQKGYSVSDNDKEKTLPVLDSYTDEKQELFFFGWYKEKDAAGNGTGERIVSKTKIENDTKVYAKWGTGKFEYLHNTLLAVYTILSIDEDGVMKVQLSELAPSSARSRMEKANNAENNLEIPSRVKLEGDLEEFGTAEVTSIGSGAIQTTGFNTVTIPDTVETVEDNAFGESSGIQSIVVPDSVQEATADAFKTKDSTEEKKISVVCGGETAERLQKSSNSANTIQVSIVEVFFKDYAYTDKKMALGESFKVTPVVKTTVGDSSTESSENVNVTLSASCEGYMSGKQNDDGSYSVKALKATEEKKEYQLTAEYAGIKNTIQLSVEKTSLQELIKDTENRFVLNKLDDVVYDGKAHKLPVVVTDKKNNTTLTENSDYTVSYSSDATNAGTVTVTVTGTGNYTGELTTSYSITKKEITIQAKDVTFTYGQKKKVDVTTKDDVKLTYKSADSTIATVDKTGNVTGIKAGETYIIVTAKGDNYIQTSIQVKVTIAKATIDVSGVTFKDQKVTYDGKAHSLAAANVPEGVTESYEGNGKTNAGAYTVTAKFAPKDAANYNAIPDMTATLTIEKATIDMSGVSFKDQKITYDGKAHSLAAANVPAGVTVSYEGNGKINAGTYNVTAKFEPKDAANYNAIASKTATLTIEKANVDLSGVVFADQTVTYDGNAHSLTAANVPAGVTVSYVGNEQVNTGTYTVTAKFAADGNYSGTGEKTATLTILLNKGYSHSDKTLKYKVVNNAIDGTGTVSVVGYKAKKAKLTKVSIPATVTIQGRKYLVTDIAKNAFKGCSKLKSLTIGKNVVTIGNSAFEKCSALTKVTLPAKVKTLGSSVFKSCKKLKTITVKSKVVKSVGKNAFKGINSKATIKVPSAKLKAYQKLFKKKGQGSKVKIKK